MARSLLVLTLLVGFMAQAKNSGLKEELTCGLVIDVQKKQQKVVMKPFAANGELEKTVITRMVLPESLNVARIAQGNPRMKFCIQMPIAQGGKYKTWATVYMPSTNRLSKTE